MNELLNLPARGKLILSPNLFLNTKLLTCKFSFQNYGCSDIFSQF